MTWLNVSVMVSPGKTDTVVLPCQQSEAAMEGSSSQVATDLGKVMDRYKAIHKSALTGGYRWRYGDEHGVNKFLVYYPTGQLANRLRGLLSAFALALVTDRALLISFRYSYKTTFSDLFQDPGFDIEYNHERHGHLVRSSPFDPEQDFDMLTCSDLKEGLLGTKHTLVIYSSYYFANAIAVNPYHQQFLKRFSQTNPQIGG